MFRRHRVYMHKNAMDVALVVAKCFKNKVRGTWINLGYDGNPWALAEMPWKKLNPEDWRDITLVHQHKRIRPGVPC